MSPFTALALATVLTRDPIGVPRSPETPELTEKIEEVSRDTPPPWKGLTPHQVEALLLVTAYEESHISMNPPGPNDGGKAHCAFQIHSDGTPWAPRIHTIDGCVRAAMVWLRSSAEMAPDAPLAQYYGSAANPKVREWAAARLHRAMRLADDTEAKLRAWELDERLKTAERIEEQKERTREELEENCAEALDEMLPENDGS
jgi:hypothetical protein